MTYDEFNEACILMIEEEKRQFKVVFLSGCDESPETSHTYDSSPESKDIVGQERESRTDDEKAQEDDLLYEPNDIMMVPLWEGDIFGEGLTYSIPKLYKLAQIHGMEYVRGLLRAQIRSIADANRRNMSRSYRSKLSKEDQALYDRLKRVRSDLSRDNARPAYTILTNKSLYDLCIRKPTNLQQLRGVFGFGDINTRKYGQAFLDEIAAYMQESCGDPGSAGPADPYSYENGLNKDPQKDPEDSMADVPEPGQRQAAVREAKSLYRATSGKIIPFP